MRETVKGVCSLGKMSANSAVIKFGFSNHKQYICKSTSKRKHSATCKYCNATLTEVAGTTSNFCRHLERNHRFLEYKAGLEKDVKQPTLQSFTQKVQIYSLHSPRQQAITEAIVKDLTVGSSLPLSFVENGHFKHFLEIVDCKYTPADRRLRSFLGVTAHVCCKTKDSYVLESYLLDCRRFTGRHSGEQIASALEEITEEYGISQKITYIITHNAANMKCAFKVHMPQQQSDDSESEEENLDDEHLWEDMTSVEDTELPWSSSERLSCFAHSLQLVVTDGMKEVRAVSRTIAKTSRFTTLLHSSSQFKDKFEAMFDTSKTVPAANNTRWNNTFKQVQSLTALDHKALTEMCSKNYEDVIFRSCEWNQLKELCSLLAPFSEATDLTEGEKSVTISMVALRHEREKPFDHKVYFLAIMLDPQFNTLTTDVENIMNTEEDATESGAMNVHPPSDSPPAKCPRLLSRYKAQKKRNLTQDSSIVTQIGKYFEATQDSDTDNALVFRAKNRDRFSHLHKLALKMLTVPASSAPVERVFSRGGIKMRPHWSRLGHKMLQSLIHLKCNQTLP
uniref:HAT C-terminal dimerisation domain-containing protein n=1 Tax=Stegastes partitus TaxID=144197 RepID=A0A3B4ZLE7_9TELE